MKKILVFIYFITNTLLIFAEVPVNGSTGISVTPNFSFNSVAVPPTTHLQVSTTNVFNPGDLVLDVNLSNGNTSYTFNAANLINSLSGQPSLNYNTTYYWRIYDVGGSSVVEPVVAPNYYSFTTTAMPNPTLSTPANNSSGISITPTFTWSWSGVGTPTYTIEIATDLAFTNIVFGPQTVTSPFNLSDIDALDNGTIYYWRITATLGLQQSVSVAKFSTIPQGKAILQSPVDATIINGNVIKFEWLAPYQGLKYSVEVDDNPNFTSPVSGFPTPMSTQTDYNFQFTISSLPAGTYYWRVKSYTINNTLVSISSVWSFIIPGPPTAIPMYPTNGTIIYTVYPTIYWTLNNNYNNAPNYCRVRWGTTSGGPYTNTSVPTLNNFIVLSGFNLATTYYYVIDVSQDISFTSYTTSTQESFAIYYASIANVPIYQTYPTTGTIVYSLTPTLYWFLNIHLPGVTFDLQVDDDAGFTAPILINQTGISGYQFTTSPLTAGTTYWWRVRINGGGTWYTQSFHVDANAIITSGNYPVIPTPTYPTSSIVIYTQSPTLQWIANSSSQLEYQVIWSSDPTLSGGVLVNISAPLGGQSGWLITNQYNLTGLTPGTTYYWQVRSRLASNPSSMSNYSSVAQFTVSPGALPVVVLPANPIYGAELNSSNVCLSWVLPAQSSSPLKFDLELSTNEDLTNPLIIRNIHSTNYTIDGLKPGKYYWRVQSKTSNGEKSEYSYKNEFIVGSVTDVSGNIDFIKEYSLEQNYPNPFNPSTMIKYTLPHNSFVTLKIYDILGREIKTLVSENQNSGQYSIQWDGTDNSGNRVTSGIYIYKIVANNYVASKKMILMK